MRPNRIQLFPLFQATQARAKEFDELKVENTALKARVQLLEEGQTKDLTILVGQKMDEGKDFQLELCVLLQKLAKI